MQLHDSMDGGQKHEGIQVGILDVQQPASGSAGPIARCGVPVASFHHARHGPASATNACQAALVANAA